jgi:hypothetical protein
MFIIIEAFLDSAGSSNKGEQKPNFMADLLDI